MTRKRWVIALVAVAAVVSLTLVFASASGRARPDSDPVAVTVPVALTTHAVPANTKIGVVLTLGEGEVAGVEWAQAAQGAAIAAARLEWGGAAVRLFVEDDRGSKDGALKAIAALAARGVSGIVLATAGPHLRSAAKAAIDAGISVVLPYAQIPAGLRGTTGIWSLAPAEEETRSALRQRLADFAHPLLLDLGGGTPAGIAIAEALPLAGTDFAGLAALAAARSGAEPEAGGAYPGGDVPNQREPAKPAVPRTDVLVVSGHARAMGEMVAALQAKRVTVPIILDPVAVSPLFSQALDSADGVTSATLQTAGIGTGDAAAFQPTSEGRSMSAYLQALRQLAEDPRARNLSGDLPFADSAAWADGRSHDAVLAIAVAASVARSPDPPRVHAALRGLKLVAGDGIAGPSLDFAHAHPQTASVRILHLTNQPLGLRPESDRLPPSTWFPVAEDRPAISSAPSTPGEG